MMRRGFPPPAGSCVVVTVRGRRRKVGARGNTVAGGARSAAGSAPPGGACTRPRSRFHSPAPRSTRMCREPVTRRWSHEVRGAPRVTSGPVGATTVTVSPRRASPSATPRMAPASERPANRNGSLTRSSSALPDPVSEPVTGRAPGRSRTTSRSASTETSRAIGSDAALGPVPRGVVAGGHLERPVQLPGGARRVRSGVAGDLDGHVDEAVVDGRLPAGQEGPHLPAQVGPVDDLLLLDVVHHAVSPPGHAAKVEHFLERLV